MIARGQVIKGVVVLESGVQLPEGAKVQVFLEGAVGDDSRAAADMIRQLAALPLEGAKDPFSGAQHDELLYGT